MKKILFLLTLIISISIFSIKVDAAETVTVTIPTFPVTVNGQMIENTYNQYPFIVYKGITYYPMAYDYARFLGLKANWYEKKGVLFIGVTENPAKEFNKYSRTAPNKKAYTAVIPTYDIAVNTTNSHNFLDNGKEEYPILNFRDITYFPITWRFAVEEFGWQYSWDNINGLQVYSSEPFRPVIDDRVIGYTLPNWGEKDYFYGENYYIGFPYSTLDYHYDIVIRKRGEEEQTFNIQDQLQDGDYYFNQKADEIGIPADPVSDIKPSIEGNVFSIFCLRISSTGNENVLLKIDLDTGKIISKDNVPLE